MPITKVCEWCGIEFDSDHWECRKYCSQKCGMKGAGRLRVEKRMAKVEKFIAENANEHICACGCGEYIVITEAHYPDSIPKYIHGHNARRDRSRFNKILVCKYCGGEFEINAPYERDYCSKSCWAKAMSQMLAGKGMVPRFMKICEICGCVFETMYGGQRFCGHKCRLVFFKTIGTGKTHVVSDEVRKVISENSRRQWADIENRIKMSCIKLGIDRKDWDGFASLYCEKWNEKIRQQVRDFYNNCDFMSGLPDYICNVINGKVEKLSVHHVDYDKTQGCEGVGWKLVPLSRLNHGRTIINRSFWERLICYALEYDEIYEDF